MNPPLIPGLAEELTAAAWRLHRRRLRRLRAAAVGSVAAVFLGTVAVATTLDAPPASAGVQITERDGRVEVLLTDVETRAGVVEDALEDAGLDADVVAVPVSPSLAGQFVGLSGSTDGREIVPLDGNDVAAPGFSIPVDYPGHLELQLGRPARSGETYRALGNALSAGEPLACLDVLGLSLRDLAAVADDHPDLALTIAPYDDDGPVGGAFSFEEALAGPYADWLVAEATAIAADGVLIEVTVDGVRYGQRAPTAVVGCD